MKLIDIKNLTFEYFRRDDEGNVEEMIEALKNVSMDIKQGEFVAILGQNGSGKSTLARHINALLLPGEGEVIVDGMDTVDEEMLLRIRRTAGMVFQNPDNQIIGNLVEEDIAFGPENLGVPTGDIWNRVDKALELTGMEMYCKKSPNQLSGGQKQKLAIAGVLAMEPKCIIFDEATAMLDPGSRIKMINVAKRLNRKNGITIILITHYMDEVLSADQVFVMKEGRIEIQGKPMEIFAKKELLESCGLTLPPIYTYLQFLEEQDIITNEEKMRIHTVEQLVKLLQDRYGRKIEEVKTFTQEKVQAEWEQIREEYSKKPAFGREGLILDNVTYIYNKGFVNETTALRNVNLFIGKGEFIAIIGRTGSGKSTLMQHLNGLYFPTEGTVYYDGQDIADKDYPIKLLRQKVGLVFQYPEYQLFAETVEKDVCFGPENMDIPRVEAQKRAYEAITAVGLPDTIYDTSPLQLSGGQKRRVAIAGVLAMQPEFLVLDEPTAGLDPYSAQALLQILKKLQNEKGITIVIVSHSMEETAEYADRIVVMDEGQVYMDDLPCKVFSQEAELQQIGLDVPVGIKIMKGLRNVKANMDMTACKKVAICGELLKLKE